MSAAVSFSSFLCTWASAWSSSCMISRMTSGRIYPQWLPILLVWHQLHLAGMCGSHHIWLLYPVDYIKSADLCKVDTAVSFSAFLHIRSSFVSRTTSGRVDDPHQCSSILLVWHQLHLASICGSYHIWLLHPVDCIKSANLCKVRHRCQFFSFPAYPVKFGKQDDFWQSWWYPQKLV